MAKVSVAILSYNRPDYLKETLESVLAQTRRPDEMIIFDNGSCDTVVKLASDYSKLGVLFRGSDETKTASWNSKRAVDAVSGEYVLLLHDDDALLPEFIEKQIGFLEEYPDAAGITCNFIDIDNVGNPIEIPRLVVFNEDVKWFKSSAEVALVYAKGGYLLFPTMLYKSSYAKKIFSTNLDEFGQVADVALLCELAKNGPIAYQNHVLYKYRRHPGQDSSQTSYALHNKLNDYMFDIKSDNPSLEITLKANIRIRFTWMTMEYLRMEFKRNILRGLLEGIILITDRKNSLREAARYIIQHYKNKYYSYHKTAK